MRRTTFAIALIAAAAGRVFAVDGQVLINQSTLNAAGGTYTISQPGSYKLSGNLTVPTVDSSAIVIAANNVTIDLNGFSIIGPVNCAGGFLCGSTGTLNTGHGIRAGTDSPPQSYFNITIRNGSIHGMGADGIHLLGDNVTLENLNIRSNGLSGILVRSTGLTNPGQTNLILRHCNIQLNGSYGIKTYGGLITDNTIDQSGNSGISVQVGGSGGAVVARNVVSRSSDFGLSLYPNVSYHGNTMVGNALGAVSGGVNLGQNLCNNVACP